MLIAASIRGRMINARFHLIVTPFSFADP